MSLRDALGAARTAWWLRACAAVGEQPHLIGRPTVIVSGGRILIGNRLRLNSRPVQSHLVTGPRGVLEIGDDVSIAYGAAIGAYESVQIGDGTCMGPFVVIMDTNFHGGAGDQSVRHECRAVVIGRDCRIGSRVTITRGATIGDGAEILAGSVVSSAIPPGVCAGGARARIIGFAGEAASRWESAAAAITPLAMESFRLETPPDIYSRPSSVSCRDEPGTRRLVAAIADRFDVTIGVTTLGHAGSFAEVAAEIERARGARSARLPDRSQEERCERGV